jgi:hypothetical protein
MRARIVIPCRVPGARGRLSIPRLAEKHRVSYKGGVIEPIPFKTVESKRFRAKEAI